MSASKRRKVAREDVAMTEATFRQVMNSSIQHIKLAVRTAHMVVARHCGDDHALELHLECIKKSVEKLQATLTHRFHCCCGKGFVKLTKLLDHIQVDAISHYWDLSVNSRNDLYSRTLLKNYEAKMHALLRPGSIDPRRMTKHLRELAQKANQTNPSVLLSYVDAMSATLRKATFQYIQTQYALSIGADQSTFSVNAYTPCWNEDAKHARLFCDEYPTVLLQVRDMFYLTLDSTDNVGPSWEVSAAVHLEKGEVVAVFHGPEFDSQHKRSCACYGVQMPYQRVVCSGHSYAGIVHMFAAVDVSYASHYSD